MNCNKNKNENSINSYYSEEEIMKKTIRIPSREGTYSFNRFTYEAEAFRDIITKFEYDNIIENASKIMGNSLLKKKRNDKFEVSYWTMGLSLFSLILIICYLFILYLAQDSTNPEAMIYLAIIFVSASLLIITVSAFYNFFRATRKYQTIDEIIKKDLDQYFENINNKYSFTRTVYFTYISEKKIIECQVKRAEKGKQDVRKIGSVFPLLEIEQKFSGDKVVNSSILKEEDQKEGINADRADRNIISSKHQHFRINPEESFEVKKSIDLNPKDIEIEMNKS